MSDIKPIDVVLVIVQLALFLLYFWPQDYYSFELPVFIKILLLIDVIGGLIIACLASFQLDKNLSVFPSPKEESTLFQGGLYAHIRHPIYMGLLIMFFAFGLHQGSPYKIGISLIILTFFYFKTTREEAALQKKFSEYADYKKKSGRFLPKSNKADKK